MRKLLMVLAVVFATSFLATAGVEAAACPTKHVVRHCLRHKHKAMKAWRHHKKRVAKPAAVGRGPIVNVPAQAAPIINVPAQAAPIVNVPEQPAPVVNVAAPPPTVGITTDNTMIYIVRGNQLMVLDKCTYEVKKTMSLD